MAHVKAVLFDANETLLDLAALDPILARVYGDPRARVLWFRQVVELVLATTVLGRFRPFGELADAALDMTAAQFGGVEVREEDRQHVHAAMLRLPAHPDVRPALERLRATRLTLAVLTNTGSQAIGEQLERAGLRGLFDAVLSADGPERYKPHRDAYAYAARELGVGLDEVRLVAAHGWDVSGALAAGAKAAFVARPGKALDPRAPAPDVVGADLVAVAERIARAGG